MECVDCKQFKSENDFRSKNSENPVCKKCNYRRRKERDHKKREALIASGATMICNFCNIEKSIAMFAKGKKCLDCKKTWHKKHALKKRQNNKNSNEEKTCKLCGFVGTESKFSPRTYKCKICFNKQESNRRKNNRKDINERERRKYNTNIDLRFKCKIRKLTARHIHEKNVMVDLFDILNCKSELFDKWLEFNYDEKINKSNYGSYWEVDHVVPIGTFDMKDNEQKRICYSWFNTSPLYSKMNASKCAEIDKIQLKTHIEKIHKFIMSNKINNECLKDIIIYTNTYAKLLDAGKPSKIIDTTSQLETNEKELG